MSPLERINQYNFTNLTLSSDGVAASNLCGKDTLPSDATTTTIAVATDVVVPFTPTHARVTPSGSLYSSITEHVT